MQGSMNENFHWRHLKSQRWIQESLDRCLVLFCYLYAQNNGDFSKFDWAMDENIYRGFFSDLIESNKIKDSSLWEEESIKNLVTTFTKGEAKRKYKKSEKIQFFDLFQGYVRFHTKAYSKSATFYTVFFFIMFLLLLVTTISSIRSKMWLDGVLNGFMASAVLLFTIYSICRQAVQKRKLTKMKWRYIFTDVDYEFCFFKLSEEIEYVDQKFRYMYEVLEEMVMRKAVLVKIDGKYKIAEGKTLADLLNVMDEYYYKDEELFTPLFIAKNILDSKGNLIRAKSVSEFRSRKREVVE